MLTSVWTFNNILMIKEWFQKRDIKLCVWLWLVTTTNYTLIHHFVNYFFVKILCKCSNTAESYVILVIFHEGIILMKIYANLYMIYSNVLSTRSSNISEQNIQHLYTIQAHNAYFVLKNKILCWSYHFSLLIIINFL